jgi:hypothetical protein
LLRRTRSLESYSTATMRWRAMMPRCRLG